MATINKKMKTFNVPEGSDVKCYEIVDDAGRKCIALDWDANSTRAFAIDEYVIKDGIVYRFKETHAENTAWNSSQVVATNFGAELTAMKNNIVVVQDATPTVNENKIWFPSTKPDPIVVPTYAEFEALDNAVKSGTNTDKNYHMGFYLDSDGDLCQAE